MKSLQLSLPRKETGILLFWSEFPPWFSISVTEKAAILPKYRRIELVLKKIVCLTDKRDDSFSTSRAFMQQHRLLFKSEDYKKMFWVLKKDK